MNSEILNLLKHSSGNGLTGGSDGYRDDILSGYGFSGGASKTRKRKLARQQKLLDAESKKYAKLLQALRSEEDPEVLTELVQPKPKRRFKELRVQKTPKAHRKPSEWNMFVAHGRKLGLTMAEISEEWRVDHPVKARVIKPKVKKLRKSDLVKEIIAARDNVPLCGVRSKKLNKDYNSAFLSDLKDHYVDQANKINRMEKEYHVLKKMGIKYR